MTSRWFGAVLFALVCSVTSQAEAQEREPKAVAVWLLGGKKLPKAARAKLPAALEGRVIDVPAWRLVMPAKTQKREVKRLTKRCKPEGSIGCVAKYGALLQTAYVLVANIGGKRKELELALSFVDVTNSEELISRAGALGRTTWEEDAGKLLDDLIPAAARATAPPESPPELPASPEPPEPVAAETVAASVESEAIAASPADASTPDAASDTAVTAEAAPATAAVPVGGEDGAAGEPATAATETIRAAPQTDAATVVTAEPAAAGAAGEARRKPMFGFGLHMDLLIPAGAAGAPSFDAGLTPSAGHTATFALLAEARFYLPEPLRDLAISLEIGWYQLQQSAQRDNANDPDFASFEYASTMHLLPILVGPVYRLPLPLADLLPLPLYLFVGAGFVIQAAWSTTSYTSGGTTVTDATQSDYGLGWYGGVEAGLGVGPGLVTVAVRYMAVYTDLQFKQIYNNAYNETDGNTAGTSLTLGYRIEL